MGSMAVAGAIIAAGAVAGSAISSVGASSVNSSSQNFAAAQNQAAMDFSERMHNQTVQEGIQAENRADKRYIEQSQFNQGLQKEMLDYVFKNFNSPQAQAKALRAAGFNPSTLLGSSASPFGNVSAPASTGTSYNLGNTPTAPTSSVTSPPSLVNPLAPFGDSVKSITSSIADLARSNLDTASKERTLNLLEGEVREQVLKNKGFETANAHAALMYGIDQVFGHSRAAADLKFKINSASKLYLEGEVDKANKTMLEVQTDLYRFEGKKNEAMLPYLEQNAKAYADGLLKQNELVDEQKRTQKSQQAANYASAEDSHAGAALKLSQKDTEDLLRDSKKAFNDEQVRQAAASANLSEAEFTKQVSDLLHASDKEEFWKSHPTLRRVLSVWQATAESTGAPIGNILGKVFK